MENSSERPESEMKDELSLEIDPPLKESHATAEDWRKALHKVVPAVVVLRTTACRAFDTESAGSGYATGFVVDKRRGIILTNRHVVKPGPVAAEAMFVNREEIPVYPIYRDPVHDFGFFRYDPAAIQFLSYEEIPLAPEAACVGLEIRVVGNDSGEKISILAGTLARLDRDAPHYKKDGYNDFNTFYMQAASGTKGGSSGSPVIDWQGRAVALNAGGKKSSSSSAFFFPLERVVRALNFLQKGRDSCQDKWEVVIIPRGTVQLVRHASPLTETGMLVVDSVVPGGPSCKHMEPGDVLVRMNGEVITQFLKIETLLDNSVGQNVELEFERGGTSLTVQLVVEDLHSITPNYFLEVSGAVIHPLSYQQARNFRFRCGLVYVSEPGYMLYRAGVPRHAIIKRLADEDISNLEDFINVLSKLSRGARVPLVYINYNDRHRRKSVLVTVDIHEWYASPQIYTRDDGSGIWIGKPTLPPNSQLISSAVIQVGNGVASMDTSTSEHFQEESNNGTKNSRLGEEDASADSIVTAEVEDSTSPGDIVLSDDHDTSANSGNASVAERVIEPTLVMLTHFVGTGVIIYHSEEMGLVAVDRNTVAISASDIMISFAAFPIEIPGEAVFLHPVHNYAIIAYDPSALGPAEPALRRGESVYLVGLSRSLQATSRKSIVTNPCAALQISSAESPRYRETNMEVIELDTDFGSSFSGVLTDEHGRVKAIWASFSFQLKYGLNSSQDHQCVRGIPVHSVSQVLDKIISGAKGPSRLINGIKRPMPLVRVLEVEFNCTLLSKARSFGLSNNWIQALAKKDPVRRQVLQVNGCLAGSKAENLLEQGDMVLAINKKPVTCFNDLEDACHALDMHDDMDAKLELTIFRQGREMEICVGTDERDGNGTTRVINWCGCFVQDPHPAVRALGFLPQEGHGVYVTRWSTGSPVHRYGLYPHRWIVEVNGKPTPDLDAFVNVTKEIEDGEFVRVRTVHLNGKPQVLTLKQDLHYWPTWELCFDPETAIWHRKTIKSIETGDSL
ncbi:hypothetical protein L1987_44331 [Smallanthus sonchifolius]|uniref:Uncharacterized protein n=1 Tax=Smallanthus sonchifolius TaxID=185202 RepID=A0ACB9GQC1_9ASTR|nr:hypothetical protein L1987_44331 [Smallanthus sonchifolius]